MNRSGVAELIDSKRLFERLDPSCDGELDRSTEETILEVASIHRPLAIAWWLDDVILFACAEHTIGYEHAATRDEVLPRRLAMLVRLTASSDCTAALQAVLSGRPASAEGDAEVVAAFVAAAPPRWQVWLFLVQAHAASGAGIRHREPAACADGSLRWTASGSVRALILLMLAEARAALALAHPELDAWFSGGESRDRSFGPFRTSGRDDRQEASRELSTLVSSFEPASARRHLERAAVLTTFFDSAHASRNVNPFVGRFSGDPDAWWTLRKLITTELASARAVASRLGAGYTHLACGALVLDLLVKFSQIAIPTFDVDVRRVEVALDDLEAALTSRLGLRGTASTVVASALARGHDGSGPPSENAMEAISLAVAKVVVDSSDTQSWSVSWPLGDDYFLIELCAGAQAASWTTRLFSRRDRPVSEKLTRALFTHLRDRGWGPPSDVDIRRACLIANAFRAFPAGAVFFALPSLRTVLRSIRTAAREGFAERMFGLEEASAVLQPWAQAAIEAFEGVMSHGRVLELAVEQHFFGSRTIDPAPPMFDSEF